MTTNPNQHNVQAGSERRTEKLPQLKQTGIRVKLINTDGNAFSILGVVLHALRKAGYGEDFIKAFMVEATRSDYQHLLAVIADTVEIE